jgi:reactive intermediate/imine deaminase
MGKKVICTDRAAKPVSTYSQAMLAGNTLFIAGTVAFNARGEFVGKGDIRTQTGQVMENIKAVVEAAGGTMADIVNTTVYVTDLVNYPAVNEVYSTYFPTDPPPRAVILAGLVKPEYLVEISAIAVLG